MPTKKDLENMAGLSIAESACHDGQSQQQHEHQQLYYGAKTRESFQALLASGRQEDPM